MTGDYRKNIVMYSLAIVAIIWVIYIFTTQDSDSTTTSTPAPSKSTKTKPACSSSYEIAIEYTIKPPPTKADTTKLKIMITGGAGFIGSQLGWRLHLEGHDVILMDNLFSGNRDNLEVNGKKFGTFIRADIRDTNIIPLFQGVDVIFHFAAISALPTCQEKAPLAYDINTAGLTNVLEAARINGVRRVIFSSTSAVYESNTRMPCREDDEATPTLIYSLSKLHGEHICAAYRKTYGLDIVVLRFFNVYGPHQDFRRLSPPYTSYVVRELLNGRTPVLHSTGEQKRDYVYIDDLARLAQLVMTSPAASGETFNVASNVSISVNEIFRIVRKAVGEKAKGIEPKYAPADAFWAKYKGLYTGRGSMKKEILIKEVEKYTQGDYAKAKALLGWEPQVTMEEGLKNMVEYVRTYKLPQQQGQFQSAWG
eukprot:PhF_6_TR22199/c0_g1_i1/m.31328/K01784/galE, GALE; UDP-glucose 4-epimerase